MILRSDQLRDLRDPFSLLSAATRPAPMLTDVYRKDGAYVLQMDLPGVKVESIDVTIRRNIVTVTASPSRTDDDTFEVLLNERPIGTMTRNIALGEEIDAGAVQAEFVDGVLMLHLPLAESARPRRVNIRYGSEAITA